MFVLVKTHFYPTAFEGCAGTVITSGVRIGIQAGGMVGQAEPKILSGLYLRNVKVSDVDTLWEHWLEGVGVQCHGMSVI